MGPGCHSDGGTVGTVDHRKVNLQASNPNGTRVMEKNVAKDYEKIELKDRKIFYKETGSYTISPQATIERAKPVLQKIGAVKVELIDTKFTDGVPIFRINEAFIKPICHRQACRWALPPSPLNNPPRECFGKGMTLQQSEASALMEAIERYCAQQFLFSSTVHASYEEVCNDAISPSEFNFPSLPLKCQRCQEKLNGCFQELVKVCEEWSWGFSLIKGKPILIPSALVYYPYISKNKESFMLNDTGGLSAGNTIEEAILQGIAEVIERDALYHTFNLNNLKSMRIVNLRDIKNLHIEKFITEIIPPDKIFSFQLLNKKLKLNIPTFVAFICYQKGNKRNYFGGSGTNLDQEVGLLRALTELEQQKVRQKAFVEFDRDDLVCHNNFKTEGTRFFEETHLRSTGNVKKDIQIYLGRISRINSDVIVVNLTHPDIGIPVVRVIIPKLISYSGSPIKESVFLQAMRMGETNPA